MMGTTTDDANFPLILTRIVHYPTKPAEGAPPVAITNLIKWKRVEHSRLNQITFRDERYFPSVRRGGGWVNSGAKREEVRLVVSVLRRSLSLPLPVTTTHTPLT